jgi:hypothetical protein
VVIGPANSATAGRTSLKGVGAVSDPKQIQQVENIFFESARANGVEPPEGLRFEAGVIFYDEHGIAEVLMAGAIKGKDSWKQWTTKKKPQLGVADCFELCLSSEDEGRTYVAAERISKIFLLSWDVKANAERRGSSHPGAGMRLIRITTSPGKKQAGRGWEEKMQYDLAIYYAQVLIDSTIDLKDFLERMSDGVFNHHKLRHTPFGYAFGPLIEMRGGERPADSFSSKHFTIKNLERRDLKRVLLEAAVKLGRARLQAEKGRRPGSKNKKRRSEKQKNKDQFKKKILRMIKREHKAMEKQFGEEMADDKITKKGVVKRLKLSPTTFNKRLDDGNFNFKDLIDEAILASRNK